jgi:DNA-binding beta-propeller fold protein YncE
VREVQEIPLPGVQGRLDHFTIDAKRKRVIFSGLGNNTVQVVDVFAGRMIHQIEGLAEPQGTLYLAEWDKLFVANSANGHVSVYDGAKFTLLDTIDFGEGSDPDNLRYDSTAKKIYLGYGDGAIAVIDPVTNKRLPTEYKFEGHPESFQLESKGPRIFVNVAGGEGYLSVVQQVDADHYTDMGKFQTALGTRTGVWYAKRDRGANGLGVKSRAQPRKLRAAHGAPARDDTVHVKVDNRGREERQHLRE